MKRTLLTLCASLLVLAAIGLAPVFSEEKKVDPMEAWAEMNKPGEMHKLLKDHFEGDFNLKCKMWMDPKAEPVDSEGTAKGEMIFGGCYLKQVIVFPDKVTKKDVTGWSIMGYDNGSDQFVHTFIGEGGTGLDRANGTYDEKTKAITLECQGFNKAFGGGFSSRVIVTLTSKDEHKIEFFYRFGKMDEFKMMEMVGTRKK